MFEVVRLGGAVLGTLTTMLRRKPVFEMEDGENEDEMVGMRYSL